MTGFDPGADRASLATTRGASASARAARGQVVSAVARHSEHIFHSIPAHRPGLGTARGVRRRSARGTRRVDMDITVDERRARETGCGRAIELAGSRGSAGPIIGRWRVTPGRHAGRHGMTSCGRHDRHRAAGETGPDNNPGQPSTTGRTAGSWENDFIERSGYEEDTAGVAGCRAEEHQRQSTPAAPPSRRAVRQSAAQPAARGPAGQRAAAGRQPEGGSLRRQ